jgi:hypothetical protein
MKRAEGKWDALTSFFIKHAAAIFVIATVICLVLITYLTNHLKPTVIGAWVIVGILTSLLFSGVALVVVLAVAAVEKASHLRVITYEPHGSDKLRDRFEREKIKVENFYSPFFLLNENKYFEDCEIQGPGSILFLGASSLDGCVFKMCDYIVVKEGDKINTAAQFKNSTFKGCKFFDVALYLPESMVERLFESHKAATDQELSIIGFEKK